MSDTFLSHLIPVDLWFCTLGGRTPMLQTPVCLSSMIFVHLTLKAPKRNARLNAYTSCCRSIATFVCSCDGKYSKSLQRSDS
ncbi:hypothetical protein M3J09_010492 [Ascochyta lentis]